MAPVQYAGALQPKKKSELQEIALALNLTDEGTKDDLQARIKKHLEDHAELEEDPAFAGLFGRRKRTGSVQPQPVATRVEPVFAEPKPPSRVGRRSGPLEPVAEVATPAKDLREVSAFLKRPVSPVESTPIKSPQRVNEEAIVPTPSSLPPLPPSSPVSPAKSIIQITTEVATKVQEIKPQDLIHHGQESLYSVRQYLSDSRHILSLTALYELLYILYTVIPWKSTQIPISPKGTLTFPLTYPPVSTFQTSAFWTVLFHWFIPTLLLPSLLANLISFNPTLTHLRDTHKDALIAFDPLTASIIRLAAHIAYPYASLDLQSGVYGLDVLGFKLRVWSASLGLAFAFAETISGAPNAFAQSLRRDSSRRFLTPSRASTPMQ
ncbi:hypothetical protein D9756_008095 [Leucocoprinus leucothites]|uniref:SAP domain-containing protein n=1 Tax=Leucocoprinus leucothites TaxID=201217 RepID=A0A8H5FYL6_9AGAR|nr:hypothetical protein D9756_008095 [Leucoagaricus leucothites]